MASAIINDLGRAAATRGLAAILGAKKMKAVAVRGTKGTNIANPKELIRLYREQTTRFKKDPIYETHCKYGTNYWVGDIVMNVMSRILGRPPNKALMAEAFYDVYDKNLSCSACPLHCSHFYDIKTGKYAGTKGEGVEGNTQLAGLEMRINDAAFVCAYNNLCNQLGLDCMGTGNAIGFAMGLYDEGVISKEDTDGVEITHGNADAVFQLMHKMAANEGFGKILNLGSIEASKIIGGDAWKFISHCKKYPSYGPGFMSSVKTTLAHAIATRGNDHLTGSPGIETANRQPEMTDEVLTKLGQERYHDPDFFTDIPWSYQPKYALRVRDVENRYAIADMVGTCKFTAREALLVEGIGMRDFAQLLTVVTGKDFTEQDLHRAADREMLLERSFNAREGIRKIDDYPHGFRWELEHGECHPRYDRSRYRMKLEDYTQILEEYYRLRGCNKETGIPTREVLEQVGLGYVAEDLERREVI
jgi:aldehyde:ferredoxin oxidoreductase